MRQTKITLTCLQWDVKSIEETNHLTVISTNRNAKITEDIHIMRIHEDSQWLIQSFILEFFSGLAILHGYVI